MSTIRWVPFYEMVGPSLTAPSAAQAEAQALRLYGRRFVRVQSEASLREETRDLSAVQRGRYLPNADDGEES